MSFPSTRDYPRFVTVRGSEWEIKFCRGKIGKCKETLGLCDPESKTIQLRMGQTKKELFKTFCHEWLHAVEDEYDIDIPHPVVYQLEEAVADFMLENVFVITSFLFFLFEGDR